MAVVLRLSEAQTIREIEETTRALRESLDGNEAVLLDCEGIEETDITFLQLVIAARKSAARRGKTLGLTARARGPLLAALDRAGIQPEGEQLFWFEEGKA